MRYVYLVARILTGLVFTVLGSNFFLHFLNAPMPPGPAGEFMGVTFSTGFIYVPGAAQVLGGLMLLSGFFVPLGIVILGAVLVNIFAFHATMQPQGFALPIIVAILWFLAAWPYRDQFAPLFAARVRPRS